MESKGKRKEPPSLTPGWDDMPFLKQCITGILISSFMPSARPRATRTYFQTAAKKAGAQGFPTRVKLHQSPPHAGASEPGNKTWDHDVWSRPQENTGKSSDGESEFQVLRDEQPF